MLYFFHGTDAKKAGEKAKVLIQKMLEKKPDASVFVIDDQNCREDLFQELTQSSALFENKYIVHIKRILDDALFENIALGFLKEIKESDNIFVWNEGELKKSVVSKIEKVAEKVIETNGVQQTSDKSKNNIFEICNSIVSRDKKNLWVKYQDLLKVYAPEEIHGTMFWQFKNIAIVSKVNSLDSARDKQKDSGLAPFPYSNAKKALSNYSEDEVLERTSALSKIVHEARSGGADLNIALEKFILNL